MELQNIQSVKILSCYFEKGNRPLPEGTRSPDGSKIKRNNKWVYDRKTTNVYKQDIKEGHTYYIGKNTKATVNKIINDTVYYSYYTQLHDDDPYTVEHGVEPIDNFYNKVSQFTKLSQPIKKYNPDHFQSKEQFIAFNSFINNKNASLPINLKKPTFIDYDSLPKVAKDELKRKYEAGEIDYKGSKVTADSYEFFSNILQKDELDDFATQAFDYNKSIKDNIETLRSFNLSNKQISDTISKQYFDNVLKFNNYFNDSKIKKEIFINKSFLNKSFGVKGSKNYNKLKNLDTIINLKNEKAKNFQSIPLTNGLYGHYGDYIKVQRWDIDASSTKRLIEDEGRLIATKKSDKFGDGWVFKRKDGKTFNIWSKFWKPSINFLGFSEDHINDQIF